MTKKFLKLSYLSWICTNILVNSDFFYNIKESKNLFKNTPIFIRSPEIFFLSKIFEFKNPINRPWTEEEKHKIFYRNSLLKQINISKFDWDNSKFFDSYKLKLQEFESYYLESPNELINEEFANFSKQIYFSDINFIEQKIKKNYYMTLASIK